jgi:hypothetical protein
MQSWVTPIMLYSASEDYLTGETFKLEIDPAGGVTDDLI